jgi:hypothetical protein
MQKCEKRMHNLESTGKKSSIEKVLKMKVQMKWS